MKMRNMLRGILLLLLMASGLSVFLSCKGLNPTPTLYTVTFDAQGGSAVAPIQAEQGKTIAKPADPAKDGFTFAGWYKESAYTTPWNFATDTVTADITLFAKWTPAAPATVTVTFAVKGGHGTLTAKAGDTNLTSGAQVKKDTEVTFTAEPASGYEVDYWRINGEIKSGTTITTEKIKADKNITVTVRFKRPGDPATEFFTVDYKVEPAAGGSISAKDADGMDIPSGKKAAKGTVIVFTVVPNAGYNISDWTVATAESDNKTAKLTVMGDSSVTVRLTLKQYTVTFNARGGIPIPAPKQIEHGKTVEKPADPVKGSLAFGGWYKEKEYKTLWNFVSDTVTADITLYAQWKTTPITIQFDSSKMTSWKEGGGTITSGSTVQENDLLNFEATPPAGQTVNKWAVNGVEQDHETKAWFGYTVRAGDAQSGTITIGYTERPAAQVTIRFDSDKMKCWKNVDEDTFTHGTPVADDEPVDENTVLTFIAQPSAGKMADLWTVNGAPVKSGDGNLCWYRVGTEASSFRFEYTEKTAEKLELKFDTSKIQCTKLFDNTPIHPCIRDEGDLLIFKTTNASAVKWKINGEHTSPDAMPVISLIFTKEQAKSSGNENLMEITYE